MVSSPTGPITVAPPLGHPNVTTEGSSEPSMPELAWGMCVEYHGSQTRRHGVYIVSDVDTRTTKPLYSLRLPRQHTSFELTQTRRCSITPVPYRRYHRIRDYVERLDALERVTFPDVWRGNTLRQLIRAALLTRVARGFSDHPVAADLALLHAEEATKLISHEELLIRRTALFTDFPAAPENP